jgi:phosphoadenosine phosphosulfate reductase
VQIEDALALLPQERRHTEEERRRLAARGARDLVSASAEEVIGWAAGHFAGGVIATQSRVNTALVHVIESVGADIPVVFVDTGLHFAETLETRDRLASTTSLHVLSIASPMTVEQQAEGFGPELWSRDPDLCCGMRKVDPIESLLARCDAWLTGMRSATAESRSERSVVEYDEGRGVVKVNPLIGWSDEDLAHYTLLNDVVVNDLVAAGYPSVGCWPCTRPIQADEDPRAGRWTGFEKTECGLHI